MLGDNTYANNELETFNNMLRLDETHLNSLQVHNSWEHLQKRFAEGKLKDFGFETFTGANNLDNMIRWIDQIRYKNFIEGNHFEELVKASKEADERAFAALNLSSSDRNLDAIATYNAQDMIFANPEPAPDRLKPRVVLDFGAGHGRQANLWSQKSKSLETFIAVDAITGPYLTQRMYYRALGLSLNDYMDNPDAPFQLSSDRNTINHMPSWRLDLIELNSVDEIIAVQVLRELTPKYLIHVLRNFSRILKPGGLLYLRDHIGFHNVNGVDQAQLLKAFGFMPVWQPMWRDKVDLHGVPRHWRKGDFPSLIG